MQDEIYVLKKADIDNMRGLDKAHFLNSKAKRNNKSLGDLTGITGFGFHIIEVQPGHQTTEQHLHYNEDECVYVISGNATAYIGQNEFQIGTGDFIGYRKSGLPHSIKNTGDQPLTCIVVGERLSNDICDYTGLGKRIYRQTGLPWHVVNIEEIQELSDRVGKK